MKKITSIMLSIVLIASLSLPAFADEFNRVSAIKDVNEVISEVEEYLMSEDSSVNDELNLMKRRLRGMLLTASSEDRSKIEKQINTISSLQIEFEQYASGESLSINGKFHLIYSPAVSAIISYFNHKKYYLSAELLTHAKENETLDSIYVPLNKGIAAQTTVGKRLIANSEIHGSSSFEKTGKTADDDLYYAIHAFTYYRDIHHKMILIYDRYDYADHDFDSIQGAAIKTMYNAQNNGVIVPYKIEFGIPI